MKFLTQTQAINTMVKAAISLVILGLSQNANAEIVDATFNWTGPGGYSTQGHFSFDNDASFLNLVTQDNGALKDFSWFAYKDGLQIYREIVVSNSVTESRNRFLDFNYDVSSNIITMIDTGAPTNWFSNRIDYISTIYSTVLEVSGQPLSINKDNVIVSLDNAVSAVPEPSTYLMMGLGLLMIMGYSRRQNKI